MTILSDNPLLALLPLDEYTKGRGGGGRGSFGSIDDNWDAPAETKAVMAFNIIWFALVVSQVYMIAKRFRNVQTTASRVPYIVFTVVLIFSAISYLASAIYTRIASDLTSLSAKQFAAFINFFGWAVIGMFPLVLFSLIHVRGKIQSAAQGNTFNPVMSQKWKQIFDGVLAGLLCTILIIFYGVQTSAVIGYYSHVLSRAEYNARLEIRKGLSHTFTSFLTLVYISFIVATIVMFVQLKARKLDDPVIKRLLVGVVPFIFIMVIELLAMHIVSYTMTPSQYNFRALDLADVIIDGFCRVAIGYVLISTMTLPGVQWNAAPGAAPPVMPGHQQGGSSYYDQKPPIVAQQPWQVTPQQQGWSPQTQPYVQQLAWAQQPQQQQQGWAAPTQPPPGQQGWQPQMQPPVVQQQQGWQAQPAQYQVWNGQPGSQPGSQPASPHVPPK